MNHAPHPKKVKHTKEPHPTAGRAHTKDPTILAATKTKKHHRPKHQAPDGHWLRRLKSGELDVEATLDLHGLTQTKALEALQRFIARAQNKGARVLLVITGKGGRQGQAGVLRQRVPEWLEAEPLCHQIMMYRPAHRKDGGDGALYVVLQR